MTPNIWIWNFRHKPQLAYISYVIQSKTRQGVKSTSLSFRDCLYVSSLVASWNFAYH
jgi:hypothetical protein